jgi:PhzF family phenazine biosynthesis protein
MSPEEAAKPRRIKVVDVFGTVPYSGNPVAVVLDGEGLSAASMERFTRWTNLSEATFILPPSRPEADYRVRIFTSAEPTAARHGLDAELPFAGHPTLGTCRVWLETFGASRSGAGVVQECGAGLIRIRQTDDGLAFAAPPLRRSGPVDGEIVQRLASMLRIDPTEIVDVAWADNGPGWIVLLLRSAEAVLRLRPGLVDTDVGVVGPYPERSPVAFEVRAFFPKNSATTEDPVTGSLHAALAQWLIPTRRAEPPYVASQGAALDRSGRVHISVADGEIWVGGQTTTCIAGEVVL